MKRNQFLYIFSFVLAGSFGSGCGSGAANGRGADTGGAPAAGEGNASFSCKLDGAFLSGSGVDEMQQRNTAFIYPVPVTGDHIMFTLASTRDGSDPKPDYTIRIYCPRRQGTFTITDADDDAENHNYVTVDFLSGDLSRYRQNSVTVTITTLSNSRAAGTFSGKLDLSDDTPRGTKKAIVISDGKFDIPFSTSNIRPL